MRPVESDETLIDFNNPGDFDALYMDAGYDKSSNRRDSYVVTVLKSETGSEIYAYIFNASRGDHNNQSIINLSNCIDINMASGFATSVREKVLYYTVDNKIYSVSLAGAQTPVSFEVYSTPESGDKITSIEVWLADRIDHSNMFITDINNPDGDPVLIDAQHRMLLITTYNQGTQEGKVICVPITIFNVSQNGLEKNTEYHRVFGGFGRILSMDHSSIILY